MNTVGVETGAEFSDGNASSGDDTGDGTNGGSGGESGNDNAGGTPDQPDNGQMEVTGVLTDEGVECPALRGRNGQLYTLAGDTEGFETGDAVTVTGTRAEVSFCQQGTTIAVESIEQAP